MTTQEFLLKNKRAEKFFMLKF